MSGAFEGLHPRIRELLLRRGMAAPTPPQADAIPVIASGSHVLLVAPTGSGKTEAALLPTLDAMMRTRPRPTSALYVTPLRALNRDLIDRISWWASQLEISVAVRHGDTPADERRRQARSPPDLLVTTPETLQVLLVADVMRKHLANVRWVIVDEIHELAEDKRGSQLAVMLERLARLAGEHQRIGLSATVGSPSKVGSFLVGPGRGCTTVESRPPKPYEIRVVFPGSAGSEESHSLGLHPAALARLRALLEEVRSSAPVLVFTNTRSESEILISRLRLIDPEFRAEVHHSSISLDRRLDAESRLKRGELDAVICTSSLELGIDVGAVNAVVQYGSPRQVTRLLQRVGRSGHSLERVSRGIVIAVDDDDALEAAVIARRALAGQLEEPTIPHGPYDVLVQQVAGLLLEDRVMKVHDLLDLLRRSYPYRDLSEVELSDALDFMSGLRPPLARFSQADGAVYMPASARRLLEYHFDTLTMIPEEPKYVVSREDGEPVGVLDEEFVAGYVSIGVKFVLAGRPWVVKQVVGDRVIVEESDDPTGAIPSWVGEEIPVPQEVAQEVGALRRRISESGPRILVDEYGMSPEDAERAAGHVLDQARRGFPVPSDVLLTVERWEDYSVLHVHMGLKANRTLARLLAHRISQSSGEEYVVHQDPYRVYLRGNATTAMVVDALRSLAASDLEAEVRAAFEDSWMFMRKLVQAARKMGVVGAKSALSGADVRRLRDALRDTLVNREAWRALLEEDLDVRSVGWLLRAVSDGSVRLVDLGDLEEPTPMARVGLERAMVRGEVVDRARLRRLVLSSARARLNAPVTLACMDCLDYAERTRLAGAAGGDLTCPVCGSRRVAVLDADEDEVRAMLNALLERGRPPKDLEQLHRRALQTAALVEKYGYPGAVASLFRISRAAAERILSRWTAGAELDVDDLLMALVEEERGRVVREMTFRPRRT
ncbi:MAG: DEAD/DEAH box helicase [Conexivisphaera sp.]